MPRSRLGVALLVPPGPAGRIDVVRRALGAAGSIGRIAPHVTLVPPVNVAADQVAEAEAVVRAAARAARPLDAVLGPPATFLPETAVLFLQVGPGAAAEAVGRLRDAVFVAPLARTVTRPFVPHCTLVDGGDPARIDAGVGVLADLVEPVTFTGVALLEEHRDAEGVRVWRPRFEAPFGGPSVVARGGRQVELVVGDRLGDEEAAWAAAAWDDHDRSEAGPGWAAEVPVAVSARLAGAVVGTATGFVRGDEGHLQRLMVGAAARDEGIGSHLLAAFTAAVAERGAHRVVLRTAAGGPAERFYRDRGFVVVATLPRWRRDADFVLLERPLTP